MESTPPPIYSWVAQIRSLPARSAKLTVPKTTSSNTFLKRWWRPTSNKWPGLYMIECRASWDSSLKRLVGSPTLMSRSRYSHTRLPRMRIKARIIQVHAVIFSLGCMMCGSGSTGLGWRIDWLMRYGSRPRKASYFLIRQQGPQIEHSMRLPKMQNQPNCCKFPTIWGTTLRR